MSVIRENITFLQRSIPSHVRLVAVSKTKSVSDITEAYEAGQRIFGENKVQELIQKQDALPKDISWHFIGHLQTNKVKFIASFIDLVHSVDSLKLLMEIDKEAKKINRHISCLFEMYIAKEESKFGLDYEEINTILSSYEFSQLENIKICGLMGMATYTDNLDIVRKEFHYLSESFQKIKAMHFQNDIFFTEISMGMSSDYKLAIEEGSTMVRIGSSIFGERIY